MSVTWSLAWELSLFKVWHQGPLTHSKFDSYMLFVRKFLSVNRTKNQHIIISLLWYTANEVNGVNFNLHYDLYVLYYCSSLLYVGKVERSKKLKTSTKLSVLSRLTDWCPSIFKSDQNHPYPSQCLPVKEISLHHPTQVTQTPTPTQMTALPMW